METLILIVEFLGTFAAAISGTRLAAAKRFDWFGGYVVGLATAIGGGTLRDVMIDQTPFWMTKSIYITKVSHLPFYRLSRIIKHCNILIDNLLTFRK